MNDYGTKVFTNIQVEFLSQTHSSSIQSSIICFYKHARKIKIGRAVCLVESKANNLKLTIGLHNVFKYFERGKNVWRGINCKEHKGLYKVN